MAETAPVTVESEEEASFDELFTLKTDAFPAVEQEEEEEEGGEAGKKKKEKKKKGRKFVEIVYDPDADLTVARKKHKRGDGEIEWE